MANDKKTIVILQPGYIPWLGFFNMMHSADLFIYHTDVQYDKQSWRNRNRIRTAKGFVWLTVPVQISGHSKSLIRDIRIDGGKNWRRDHLNLLKQNYMKAPFYEYYIDYFEELYANKWEFLIDVDLEIVNYLIKELGISTKVEYSTNFDLKGLKGQDRVLAICEQAGATEYLSGPAGKAIYFEDEFRRKGVDLAWHNYPHPVYRQQFDGFVPYLSVIDLMFNHGPESMDIIDGVKMVSES